MVGYDHTFDPKSIIKYIFAVALIQFANLHLRNIVGMLFEIQNELIS